MSMSTRRTLQAKVSKLNQLQEKLESQQAEIEETVNRLGEIGNTLIALDDLSEKEQNTFESFINLGADVYVKAEITVEKEKILQEIGAGVSLSLTLDTTQKRLRERQEKLRDQIQDKQEEINETIQTVQKLRSEINEIQRRLQSY